jgi:CheY-like chemotaxis protein
VTDRNPESPHGGARPSARVLVIDDDAQGREALGHLLRLSGYAVDLAESGERGIELALRHVPAIAFIDITLPDLDGCEVARRIRAGLKNGETRLVAFTGHAGAADRRRAEQAGFDQYLVKPVEPELLLDLVASVSRS